MSIEPTIQEFMTQQPQAIESRESVLDAQTLMKRFGIRHLPVTTDGIVVGILSERELSLALGMDSLDHENLPVIDVCSEKPYIAYPETSLREVVGVMAREHLGSVIIMEDAKLVGIFTTVDACRALHDLIDNAMKGENLEKIRSLRSLLGRRF